MKTAVCLLAPKADHGRAGVLNEARFLSVSRRNDTTLWGFPGGKVDAGENCQQGLLREAKEEVGLSLAPEVLVPLYSAAVPGKSIDDTYWVVTYVSTKSVGHLTKHLLLEQGLTHDWRTEAQLCDPQCSPFAGYNRQVFLAYKAWLATVA